MTTDATSQQTAQQASEKQKVTEAQQQDLPAIVPEVEELKAKYAQLEAQRTKELEELNKFKTAEKATKDALKKQAEDEKNFAEMIRLRDEQINELNGKAKEVDSLSQRATAYESFLKDQVKKELESLAKEEQELIKKSPAWNDDPIIQAKAIQYHKAITAQFKKADVNNPFHTGKPSGNVTQQQYEAAMKKGNISEIVSLRAEDVFKKLGWN